MPAIVGPILVRRTSPRRTVIAALIDRLKSTQIELQDIASEAEHIDNSVSYDEKRIDQINEKLSVGYKLLKKHSVQTTSELLEIKRSLEEKQSHGDGDRDSDSSADPDLHAGTGELDGSEDQD